MHGLKSAIDRGADAWARSLPGRVLDRYVSRSGPLLANGLAYGLLFAFFAGVWIAVSVFGLIMGSLTVSAMQLLGARLLAGASRNPMLAPFAALIGVLIWFNLVAQVILLCAALIAECRQKS